MASKALSNQAAHDPTRSAGWPDEDRGSAPFTGWTRAHWEATADALLLAPRRYATASHALVHLPGPASRSGRWSDGLEGFARTFLLAGFRLAGAGGDDPHDLAGWYARGIAAGVDPGSPERWPRLTERRQAHVEAASVAIGLHETRPWIWSRLSDRTRAQVVDWLGDIVGQGGYGNNWVWFQNIVEAFLRTVDGPWDPADIERNLAAHESWYVADGWYTDGGVRNFDYYVGWAMHFYPVWYSRILGAGADPAFAATTRDRLRRFLLDAQHLVAAGGAPVLQGRSLTYRFAMLAPFWAGAVADAQVPADGGDGDAVPPGVTRRLANGVLRYFLDHGSRDERGLLPIGWHGPFPRIRQYYSGPGSPYWASKGFAGLVLPSSHPVWTAAERPLPVESGDAHRVIEPPGWIVSATRADGIVRVLNHGTDHAAVPSAAADLPFYARHGYASHAAPELSHGDARGPVDSHVALLDAAGRPSHRTPLRRVDSGPDALASCSRAHWLELSPDAGTTQDAGSMRTGPWLTTATLVRGGVEVRLARVDPVPQGYGRPGTAGSDDPDAHWLPDPGPWRLRFGGWAVASDAAAPAHGLGDRYASATTDAGLISVVVGHDDVDEVGVRASDGTNPLGRRSATPWAQSSSPVDTGRVYAAVVALTGVPSVAEDARRTAVRIDGADVTVEWPDGTFAMARLTAPDAAGSR
ncbi:DUF2264 domain-containing protein [Jiangella rhizosphaerae]|uniref:DUF2264 domain-containing protein n=1 Tax=Jiangella rhizosphaerae TaxID=2293569 RepID=A0A418KJ46_9ACTN|nr:DUF2264 domain-containing protein [Jiangella rhizosphaerae]RIQ13643.1 DUF2264 domain-containing protein [Jiangella rhizosphaerae]